MQQQKAVYDRDGYYVARGMFSRQEVDAYIQHYMRMNAEHRAQDEQHADPQEVDPLKQYPRMLQMHHWDDVSLRFMIDPRIAEHLAVFLGEMPYAVQTMIYFKPPGARGQALHQDNLYLKVQPGTCMAAWMALDDCDEFNGCLQVVPGSHTWDILCTTEANTDESFTDVTVPLPEGVEPVPVVMQAGDVLFFNGQLVHGSFPNQTQDRFRRSLIGHYIAAEAEQVGQYYFPVLRMDGTQVEGLNVAPDATTCGIWVDKDGQPIMEMVEKS